MCEIEKLFDTFGVDAWHHPSMVSIDGVRHRIIMQDSRPSTYGVHFGSEASLFGNDPRSVHAQKIKLAREFRALKVYECAGVAPGREYFSLLTGEFSAALSLLSEMVVAVLRVSGPEGAINHPEIAALDAHIEGTYGAGTVLRLTCVVATEDSPPFDLYAGIQINPMWQYQVPTIGIRIHKSRAYHSCVVLKDLVTNHEDNRLVRHPTRYNTAPMLAMSVGNTFDEACFGLDVMVSRAVTRAMLSVS